MIFRYYIRLIIISICVLFYCLHSEVFIIIYPDLETNYDVFLEYYNIKNISNEIVFSLFFLCIFLNSKEWVKSFSIFGFVMSFGSVVDKLIFNTNHYLVTDIILLIFATRLAWLAKK